MLAVSLYFPISNYERYFMDSLNHDNQADVIEAFNSTSRYLEDNLNIGNPYFEGMVNQIYPPEQSQYLRYGSPLFLFQMDLFLLKFMISAMTLTLI